MEKVRWGFIGCGDVAEIKSGPAFNKINNSEIVAVMRRDETKVKDYASRHNIPKWYTDADKLINDPEVNAIYVATPPSTHAEYAIKALNKHKPVYVEKPMASSYSDCVRMNEVSILNSTPLFVAYYRRRLPIFLKVKELVASGTIGQVKLIKISLHLKPNKSDYDRNNLPWRVIPEIAGAGYFYDLAAHQLDYLDFLFGKIIKANGITNNQAGLYDAEDIVSASWLHESGVAGSGSWCFTVREEQETDKIEFVGTKGNISFSTFRLEPIKIESETFNDEIISTWPAHVHQPLLEEVVSELLGTGKSPSTGITGSRTNWVMDRILGKI